MQKLGQAISAFEVAERLQIARNIAELTLDQAARVSKIPSSIIRAIEIGEREVQPEEFFQLAKAYGRTPSEVLHSRSLHISLVPHFKAKANVVSRERNYAIKRLNDLAKLEFDLEFLLGSNIPNPLIEERPLKEGDAHKQGVDAAIDLRKQHGLGLGPIGQIAWILEKEFGFRVYFEKLDRLISGLYAYDAELGPCILINSLSSNEEQTMTCAHELGHFIGTRVQINPNRFCRGNSEEIYANAFADEFVLPAESMKFALQHIKTARVKFSYDNMRDLAKIWNVSLDLMCNRLENLKLVEDGTVDCLNRIRSNHNTEMQVQMDDKDQCFRRSRLNLLIAEAFDQGKISEGEIVNRLGLDRISVRDLIYDHTQEGFDELCTFEIE